MDSYINLTGDFVTLGAATAAGVDDPVHKEILASVSMEPGGATLRFEKMTEKVFERLTKSFENPASYGEEGYLVDIADSITIYFTAEISKIFALYAIKRHYNRAGIQKGIIYNTPKVPFRCFLSHLPGKKALQDYKRLIDMLLAFGHNTLMIEVAGAMEYKRHPEISEGWVEYCKIVGEYNGKAQHVNKIHIFPKNSIAPENGAGEYLTQEELAEIVEYCRARHMEIIPNVPTLSHLDWMLFKHPELAECPDEPLPANACPSNEDYYKLVYDILDEVIEVFKPKRINICHDEVYVYGQCPKCKGIDPAQLIGNHMIRLHDYLAEKGIKTMIWGDGLLPMLHCGGDSVHVREPWTGTTIEIQGKTYKVRRFTCHTLEEWEDIKKENPEAEGWYVPAKYGCIEYLPKDIEVMNWSWKLYEDSEDVFIKHGLYNVFGNFLATGLNNFDERIKKGVSGVSFSAWGAADFETLQRTNGFYGLAYNSYACWSRDYDDNKRTENIFLVADAVYRHVNYDVLMKKHLEITHTTDALIEHPSFFAYNIIREDYKIGDYEILYVDGTTEEIPIYWGYNIGNSDIAWSNESAGTSISVEEGGYATKYVFESIGTTIPVREGSKTWYKFALPITKDVERVMLKPGTGYNIIMKEAIVKV